MQSMILFVESVQPAYLPHATSSFYEDVRPYPAAAGKGRMNHFRKEGGAQIQRRSGSGRFRAISRCYADMQQRATLKTIQHALKARS